MPAAIVAWPRLPSDLDRVPSWGCPMRYRQAQKTAAAAKPTAPNQFTVLNHMGDALVAGMFIAASSMVGIDVVVAGACWVLDRRGSR